MNIETPFVPGYNAGMQQTATPIPRTLALPRLAVIARALPLGIPLLYWAVVAFIVRGYFLDDAYITMRYAQHWADGHGLVWNIGEPPVEGYTNFSLTAIQALLFRLGLGTLGVVKLITAAHAVAATCGIYYYAKARKAPDWAAGLAAGCLATSTPFVVGSINGLETVMFIAYLVFGVSHVARALAGERHHAGVGALWLLLACWTRPEGALLALVSVAAPCAGWKRVAWSWRDAAGIGATIAAGVVYVWWKLAYFGHLLPVPAETKTHGLTRAVIEGGLLRFTQFFWLDGQWALVLCAVAVLAYSVARGHWRRLEAPALYLACLAGLFAFYVVSLGFHVVMDETYRYYIPLIALSSLLVAEIGAVGATFIPARMACYAGTALAVLMLSCRAWSADRFWNYDINCDPQKTSYLSGRHCAGVIETCYAPMADYLKARQRPGDILVMFDVGYVPYATGLNTLDTWSLTDRELIRLKKRAAAIGVGGPARRAAKAALLDYIASYKAQFIVKGHDAGLLDERPAERAKYTLLPAIFHASPGYSYQIYSRKR